MRNYRPGMLAHRGRKVFKYAQHFGDNSLHDVANRHRWPALVLSADELPAGSDYVVVFRTMTSFIWRTCSVPTHTTLLAGGRAAKSLPLPHFRVAHKANATADRDLFALHD